MEAVLNFLTGGLEDTIERAAIKVSLIFAGLVFVAMLLALLVHTQITK